MFDFHTARVDVPSFARDWLALPSVVGQAALCAMLAPRAGMQFEPGGHIGSANWYCSRP